MKKRSRIALIILLITVIGGLAWNVLRPKEPFYQGRPLSYWLEAYDIDPGPNAPEKSKADEAVRSIGTNCVPILLRLLKEGDSRWRHEYTAFANQHPKLPLMKIKYIDYMQCMDRAEGGFNALGPAGSNAVPELIELLRHFQQTPDLAGRIATTLGDIGPPAKAAIPLLINAATNTTQTQGSIRELRINALAALASIHSDPEQVLPVYINALADTDHHCRMNALSGIALLGRDARQAVPTLIQLLGDNDRDIRHWAAYTLKEVDPEAAAKAGVK